MRRSMRTPGTNFKHIGITRMQEDAGSGINIFLLFSGGTSGPLRGVLQTIPCQDVSFRTCATFRQSPGNLSGIKEEVRVRYPGTDEVDRITGNRGSRSNYGKQRKSIELRETEEVDRITGNRALLTSSISFRYTIFNEHFKQEPRRKPDEDNGLMV